MALQYKDGGSWTDIPAAALYSTWAGTYHVDYPPATDTAVDGSPCGAFGKPRIMIRASWMSDTGMAFWKAFFAAATDAYADISIEAWDNRAGANVKWAGKLKWPMFESVGRGGDAGTTIYRGITIEIVECTATS